MRRPGLRAVPVENGGDCKTGVEINSVQKNNRIPFDLALVAILRSQNSLF